MSVSGIETTQNIQKSFDTSMAELSSVTLKNWLPKIVCVPKSVNLLPGGLK